MKKSPTSFKSSADVFYALRDVRADVIAERRALEQSGMYTAEGLVDALDSSARLNGWHETVDAARQAVARHREVAEQRLAKARAAAVAPPATVNEQLLAEQRLSRKMPLIESKIKNPGSGLDQLIAEAPALEVNALVDHLRTVAATDKQHRDFILAAIDYGIDARDPAIAEAAEKVQHAAQLESVLSVQFAATDRVLEAGGVRADTVADHQIATGTADEWDVRLDAA